MNHSDFIVLNMMKHQLLDIYQTYHDMPHLLADTTLKEAYQSLLSVKTLDEFKQWRKLVAVLGLSFTDNDSVKRRDNMIGWLDDLAGGESDNTISKFIEWKNSFAADDWYEKTVENENAVNQVLGEVARDYDVHIVLFRLNDHWAAIGNDADRLFEIFGWQTGFVSDGEKDVSFMHISCGGTVVLLGSGYSVKYLDLGDIDIITTSFNEDLTALYQQQIDCMRNVQSELVNTAGQMQYNLSFTVPKSGYKELVKAKVRFVQGEDSDLYNVVATLEDGRIVTIANGNRWRLDELGIPIFHALGSKIGKA